MDRWGSNWLSTLRALPGIRAQRTWLKQTVIPQTITHIHLEGSGSSHLPHALYYHWEWLCCWWLESQASEWEETVAFLQTWCPMTLLGLLECSKNTLHHVQAAELWVLLFVREKKIKDKTTHRGAHKSMKTAPGFIPFRPKISHTQGNVHLSTRFWMRWILYLKKSYHKACVLPWVDD